MKNLLPIEEFRNIKEQLTVLGYRSLSEYYASDWWRIRRNLYFKTHDYVCKCGAHRKLQLHHKTYRRLGNEGDEDLRWLCGDCHKMIHKKWTEGVKERKWRYQPDPSASNSLVKKKNWKSLKQWKGKVAIRANKKRPVDLNRFARFPVKTYHAD